MHTKPSENVYYNYVAPKRPVIRRHGTIRCDMVEATPVVWKDRLYRFDRLAINVIVHQAKGGICNCDVPYSDDLQQFSRDYDRITQQASEACQDIVDSEANIVGTSAVVETELEYMVNQYTGIYTNPFLAWSRYRRHWFRTTLSISMQFHHAQMDGSHAARFLQLLQQTINHL